jgi:hypothetical protein
MAEPATKVSMRALVDGWSNTCGGTLCLYKYSTIPIMYFFARKVRTTLPIDTSLFRCGCGSRDVKAIGVPIASRPEALPGEAPGLAPLYVKEPRRPRP